MSEVKENMEKTEKEKLIADLLEKSKELQIAIETMETQRKLKIQEIKKQTNELLAT